MKKVLLLLSTIALTITAHAQFPYKLTTDHQVYQNLPDTCTTVNSEVWFNSDTYYIPLPFSFQMDTITQSHMFLQGGSTLITDTGKGIVSAFFMADANLIDKGFLGSDLYTISPIRYTTTGQVGKRIFKLEVRNAGFFNEITYTTQNDSLNLQIWLYEGSNIVELRYGSSHISHAYNYFPNKGLPTVGYVGDIDYSLNGVYYTLAGDPYSPGMDSVTAVDGKFVKKPIGLNYFPEEGTVYRFTPTSLDINQPVRSLNNYIHTRVYPTYCTGDLTVEYNGRSINANYRIVALNGSTSSINGPLKQGVTHIDVSDLPPGFYVAELNTENGPQKYKFVKM